MKALTLCLFVLAGCSAPLCVTRNGLQFYGSQDAYEVPADWSCRAIQEVEDVMVNGLPQFDASELSHYRLTIVDPATPTDKWGREVRGWTDCFTGEMVIWAYPYHPAFSALGHEMAHALQRCTPKMPVDPGHDADHADWWRSGIDIVERQTREGRSK